MTGDGGAPLAGVTIVWTGSPGSGDALFSDVRAKGAVIERLPLIAHGPPANPSAVRRVFSETDRFSRIVFTSAEAVRSSARWLPRGSACAAVGPATAARLTACGSPPDLVAPAQSAASLAESIIDTSPAKPVLFVRGNRARRTLPDRLRGAGIDVEEIEVYITMAVPDARAHEIARRIGAVADVVVMGSPSGVEGLHRAVAPAPLSSIRGPSVWISLGGTTLSALAAAGASHPVRLPSITPVALTDTIRRHLNI